MIRFRCAIHIERAREDVFALVSDPERFPDWNSAVSDVRRASEGPPRAGATYRMLRALPGGRAENELEILELEPPRAFAIRTTSGPTPFLYRYTLAERDGGTDLELEAEVELAGVPRVVEPLARQGVKRGVDDNLRTLAALLAA